MDKHIFICEDSIEGIFTGVYEAWESRLGHERIELQTKGCYNMLLFAEYRECAVSNEKAYKVGNTIRKRFGEEAYEAICQAALSNGENKADAIYKTINIGLNMKNGRKVLENLSDHNICNVFELSRSAGNEAHHLTGFVRFQELESGILFSKIKPRNNVLMLLMPHFADRFPEENFVIYDEGRKLFAVHPKNEEWFFVNGENLAEEEIGKISENEAYFQNLWKGFCSSISIKARENRSLQKQNLPLRFQKYMVEFTDLPTK